MNEFVSEITPLFEKASPDTRKAVYELAWGKAPKSSTFLNERLVKCFFGEYIIKTGSDTYGFMESPWRICVRGCVSQEGKLLETSQQPALQMFLAEQRLKDLATVGELVKGTWGPWKRFRARQRETRLQVERIYLEQGKLHGWPKENDPSFQLLLGWNNHAIRNSIREYGCWTPGCMYLEMLRNAYSP